MRYEVESNNFHLVSVIVISVSLLFVLLVRRKHQRRKKMDSYNLRSYKVIDLNYNYGHETIN